jgi:hypothetical protein
VFPVRYELYFYILFSTHLVFKGLIRFNETVTIKIFFTLNQNEQNKDGSVQFSSHLQIKLERN